MTLGGAAVLLRYGGVGRELCARRGRASRLEPMDALREE